MGMCLSLDYYGRKRMVPATSRPYDPKFVAGTNFQALVQVSSTFTSFGSFIS